MSSILTTFSGKYGDVLWSLPMVRQIARKHGCQVDMGIMPQYKNLLPLLEHQPYIDKAFCIDNWICQGSPHGDQPWEAPPLQGYDKTFHLTYRRHPVYNEPLIDLIAAQQGLTLDTPVVPFITTDAWFAIPHTPYELHLVHRLGATIRLGNYIACSFNTDYSYQKEVFKGELNGLSGDYEFIDVTKLSWAIASYIILNAYCYVGDMSSNWVLANGVGQENIFLYEPHPSRHPQGMFGKTFSNPHWEARYSNIGATPEEAAQIAWQNVSYWISARNQKNARNMKNETNQTVTG